MQFLSKSARQRTIPFARTLQRRRHAMLLMKSLFSSRLTFFLAPANASAMNNNNLRGNRVGFFFFLSRFSASNSNFIRPLSHPFAIVLERGFPLHFPSGKHQQSTVGLCETTAMINLKILIKHFSLLFPSFSLPRGGRGLWVCVFKEK